MLLEIAGDRAGRRRDLRARAGRDRTRRLLRGQARRRRAGPGRDRRASAPAPARLHDARLSRAAAVHPDAGQQQGRPRAAAEAEVGAAALVGERIVAAGDGDRADAVPGAVSDVARPRGRLDRRRLLRRIRRALAADGALLRPRPQLAPSLQVAMRDIYANPTVRRLAAALDAPSRPRRSTSRSRPAHRPSRFAYCACGAAQTRLLSWSPAPSRSPSAQAASTGSTPPSTRRSRSTRARSRRRLPLVLRPQRAGRRRQVAAARPRPRRARSRCGAPPTSASGLAKPHRALGAGERLRRHAALQRLPADARRQDRPQRRHPVARRAGGLRGPVRGRRGRGLRAAR